MRRIVTLLAGWLAFLPSGCADIEPFRSAFDPSTDSGSADFSVLVSVGESLSAGFQDLGLIESRQRESIPALIARSLGKEVLSREVAAPAPEAFVIPGYSDPGSPGTLVLVSLSPPAVEEVNPPGQPVNLGYPASYHALAVPAVKISQALRTATDPGNPYLDLVLRGRGTMVEQAASLDPTFVIAWLGSWDIQCAAVSGSVACLTPAEEFEADYALLLDTFLALDSVTGMVTANIPDVLSVPFTTTVPPFLSIPLGRIFLLGPEGLLTEEDALTLLALPLIQEGYGLPEPFGNGEPLPASVILDAAEIAAIRERTEELNDAIERLAGARGVPVADMAGLLERAREGIPVGGLELDLEFLQGGLIGIDGVHPWSAGQAIAANEFIEAVNRTYGASIPLVDLGGILDVNFDPSRDAPAGGADLLSLAPVAEAIRGSSWGRRTLGFPE